MAVSARFSVKNKADFEVGELIRFKAGGEVLLGLVQSINADESLALIVLQGGPHRPVIVSHYNQPGPFVSLGGEWLIEVVDGQETWVGNDAVTHTMGAIHSHAGGRHLMVERPGNPYGNGAAYLDLDTLALAESLATHAVSFRWNLWVNADEMRRPGGQALIEHNCAAAAV